MLTRSVMLTLVILLLAISVALALNQPGDFILVNDDTGIQRLGAMEPFFSVDQLPTEAPQWYPHPQDLRFVNKKFHWITQSPTKEYLGFASGTGNQWIGIMDLQNRWMKFISWGIETQFLDMTFSRSSKYFAYAFHGPDRRIKINILQVPGRDQDSLHFMNTWFMPTKGGERYVPLGWDAKSDTVFSFEVHDSTGAVLHHVDLNLHFNEADIPEYMKEARDKEPTGVVQPKKD